jgi:hypothetical protein
MELQLYLKQLLINVPAARIRELTAWFPDPLKLGQAGTINLSAKITSPIAN